MTVLTITDLNNATLDVGHLKEVVTSPLLTATDRFGNTKKTIAGALAEFPNASSNAAAAAASSAAALASQNAAEAAANAALIQAGVYLTEALGRAAVADGDAFKVQGDGDVAAYEYRRTDSSTSALIATYPSAAAISVAGMATLSSDGGIIVDMSARTIQVTSAALALYKGGAGYINIPTQTVSFVAPTLTFAMRLYVTTLGVIGMAVTEGAPLPGGALLLGHVLNERLYAHDPSGVITMRPSANGAGGYVGPYALIHATTLRINQATLLITTDATVGTIATQQGSATVLANRSDAFGIDQPSGSPYYVYQDLKSGAFRASPAGTLPPNGAPVVAHVVGQKAYFPFGSNVQFISSTGHEVPHPSTLRQTATLTGGARLSIDLQAMALALTSSDDVAVYDGGYVAFASQSVGFATAYPLGLIYVHLNKSTGVVGVTTAPELPPFNSLVIASVYKGALVSPHNADGHVTVINPAGVITSKQNTVEFARLSSGTVLAINIQAKTLTLNVIASSLLQYRDRYILLTAKTGAIPITLDTEIFFVYINLTTGDIGATTTQGAVPVGCGVLAAVYDEKLYAPGDVFETISLINGSGVTLPSPEAVRTMALLASAGGVFNESTHRMILPNVVYFLPSTPLRLFRAPCFADNSDVVKRDVSFWIDSKGTSIPDRFQPVADSIKLDPAQLAGTFEFGYRHPAQPDKRYIKSVTRSVAGAGALTGRSLTMLTFGDSLTEGGMGAEFKAQLEAQGATVTPVGTYISALNSNLRSEGRGFWNYRSFIGKDNYATGVGAHTRSSGGKTDTTKFENPFLKLADATDKTNHPDWCFRFTGVDRELSYTDDPVKTGNFYIFDFAWYMTEHSVAAPDFITIALSTNDINLDTGTYSQAERLQFMRLGLEVMIKQIKAALPAVKIGIVPAPAWSSTTDGDARWQTETSAWIEHCITDVAALSGTYSGLSIIPVWPFMSEDFAFPYSSSTALSSTNSTSVKTITDWVHFDDVGRSQYGQVVTAWAACEV